MAFELRDADDGLPVESSSSQQPLDRYEHIIVLLTRRAMKASMDDAGRVTYYVIYTMG